MIKNTEILVKQLIFRLRLGGLRDYGFAHAQTTRSVELILERMSKTLSEGKKVHINGFGIFTVSKYSKNGQVHRVVRFIEDDCESPNSPETPKVPYEKSLAAKMKRQLGAVRGKNNRQLKGKSIKLSASERTHVSVNIARLISKGSKKLG